MPSPQPSPKSFPPTPVDFQKCGSDNAHDLSLLQQYEKYNTYIPYGWGFTIYRAAFGPGSDARFAAGLRRLEDWVRFEVLTFRYKRNGEPKDRSDPDPSALLAERFWNEVVEEYPDKDKNVSSGGGAGGGGRGGSVVVEEGEEDFTPVGRAFIRWGDELGIDLASRNARYRHCLVIDDAALDSILEALPEEVPEAKFRAREDPEALALAETMFRGAWVWIVDRETMQAREAGVCRSPQDIRPPWYRIRWGYLISLWFKRLQGHLPESWWDVCEEDEEKSERVFWWYHSAKMRNEIRRRMRNGEPL